MKKVLLLFVLITYIINIEIIAQNGYEQEKVIQAQGKSVESIYKALKTWFVENAKYDSRNIIQIDNPDEGVLMGKSNIGISFTGMATLAMSGNISFIIDIKIKEGRFKVHFYQFSHQRGNLSHAASWDQGTVYMEMPEKIPSGKTWAFKTFHKKAIPLLNEWCNNAFNEMEQKVKNYTDKENEDW